MKDAAPSLSVIVCAYTTSRWSQLLAAVASLTQQSRSADEIIVVIDHNHDLLLQAQQHLACTKVTENTSIQGLSGARNSGIAASRGSIIAFLDDDAVAAPDWLEQLVEGYRDPRVLGVGGAADPIWPAHRAPWFPEEFWWVIGCSHLGTPQTDAYIRNFIGCNMSFRQGTLQSVAGFRTDVGRVGTYPAGCEETELCIRIKQAYPQGLLLYKPSARVSHYVTEGRLTPAYFLQRCFAEGRSKALVARAVGGKDGLASERAYTLSVLPRGVVRGITQALFERDPAKLGRSGSILAGFGTTVAGYLTESALATLNGAKRAAQEQPETGRAPFTPARVLELNVAEPLPDLTAEDPETGKTYTRALVLVRRQSQPLGVVDLELDAEGISASELAALLRNKLGHTFDIEGREDAATPLKPVEAETGTSVTGAEKQPLVSIIIATHNRTQSLATCLKSLQQLTYPNYEVIVVDNAPSSPDTFDMTQSLPPSARVRYVREDTPGLAVAHNRGLREAHGELVAFTDDDVRVDRLWLSKLVEGFSLAENVGCVTGMIVPAEMETAAQGWLEQYGGFSKGFETKIFNLTDHRVDTPLYPYTAGMFGSGASMAFRRTALATIGGFDSALGAGSKGVGGDDLAAFFEVVARGYTLVYQPAAIVHHWHRRDYAGLQRQAYGYGVGLTAFLTKLILERPTRLFEVVPLLPGAVTYALSPSSPKNAKKRGDYPKELNWLELRGMLYGPLAYLSSRWHLYRTSHCTKGPFPLQPKLAQQES